MKTCSSPNQIDMNSRVFPWDLFKLSQNAGLTGNWYLENSNGKLVSDGINVILLSKGTFSNSGLTKDHVRF